MEMEPLSSQFEDLPLLAFVEDALPHRSSDYKDKLVEKLRLEGFGEPSALIEMPRPDLETLLAENVAEILKVRDSMVAMVLSGCGRLRASASGREGAGRSRSPRRQRSSSSAKAKPELWAAVERGDKELVRQLLLEDHDAEEKFRGWTPFMKAAEENQVSILTALYENGVDIEATNNKGRSALSLAAAPSGKRPTPVQALEYLLSIGCDINRKDESGMTAKDRAVKEKQHEAVAVFDAHRG